MELTNSDKQFLELYSDSEYEKPSVTVDAVIFRLKDFNSNNYRKLPEKSLQVFLMNRNYPPYKNFRSIIGTFIDLKYDLETSMKLCVKNKVGAEKFYYEQLYTFGEKQRDPRTRVLSVSYMLLLNQNENLNNGGWFNINYKEENSSVTENEDGYIFSKDIILTLFNENEHLENKLTLTITRKNNETYKKIEIIYSQLAFDHINIIYHALDRLKNKLEYTDIIFGLLNDKFTLTELKNSYEVILGEKLLDANFRRKTSHLVLPLNEFTKEAGHRPSQLFKANPYFNNKNID